MTIAEDIAERLPLVQYWRLQGTAGIASADYCAKCTETADALKRMAAALIELSLLKTTPAGRAIAARDPAGLLDVAIEAATEAIGMDWRPRGSG